MELQRKVIDVALDVDYKSDIKLSLISSLKDLCGKKLVSDISLLENIYTQIPNVITRFLLSKAIGQERILSLSHLLKHHPDENFTLPLPCSFQDWRLFCIYKEREVIDKVLHTTSSSAQIVLSTFIGIIQGKYQNSHLRTVDLNELPVVPSIVELICKFIIKRKLRKKEELQCCKYVLKMGCTICVRRNLRYLCAAKETVQQGKSDLKLVVRGLYCANNCFLETEILHLLDLLEFNELELFSLNFCSLLSYEDIFLKLKKFCNLKALDLSYAALNFTNNPSLLDSFSETLQELFGISRINLQGCKISGCLQVLFQKLCKKEEPNYKRQKTATGENCCVAHRGKLQYLNLSGCQLTSQDLIYLTESPLSKTLMNLSLSYYKVELDCLTGLLTSMSSSLVVLDISNLIYRNMNLDPVFIELSAMEKMRCLDFSGLYLRDDYLLLKADELSGMPNLEWLSLSRPSDCSIREFENIFHESVNKSKCVKVLWNV